MNCYSDKNGRPASSLAFGCIAFLMVAVSASTISAQDAIEGMQVEFPAQRIGTTQDLPDTGAANSEVKQVTAMMPDPNLAKMSRRLNNLDWQAFERKLVNLWGDRLQARAEDEQGTKVRIIIPDESGSKNQMVIDRTHNAVTYEGDPVVAENWGALIEHLDSAEQNNQSIRLVGLGNATADTVRRAVALLGFEENPSEPLSETLSYTPFRTSGQYAQAPQRRGELRAIPFRPGQAAPASDPQATSRLTPAPSQSPANARLVQPNGQQLQGNQLQAPPAFQQQTNFQNAGPQNAGLQQNQTSASTAFRQNGIPASNAAAAMTGPPTRNITFSRNPRQEEDLPVDGNTRVVGIEDDTLDGTVKIRVVPELNAIFLIGDPEDVAKAKAMIENIVSTAGVSQPESQLYPVKNADSATLKATLDQIYETAYATNNGAAEIIAISSPNSLLVVAQKSAQLILRELIEKLDIESPETDDTLDFRVFRLQHMSAVDAGTRLQGYFRDTAGEGVGGSQEIQPGNWIAAFEGLVSIIVDYRSNSVIVKGNQRVLRNAERLIAELDVDESDMAHVVRFFPVYNTLASDVALILQNAINGQLEGAPQAFAPGSQQQFQGGNQAGGNLFSQSRANLPVPMLKMTTVDENGVVTQSGILLDVKITADANSNQLMVTGPEKSMGLIESLIKNLDRIPDAETQIKVFTILNGDANELLVTLQDIFGQDQNQFQGGGGFGQNQSLAQLPLQTSSTADGASLINLRFAVDARTNSIIASGPVGDLQVIEDLLNRLDEQDLTSRINHIYRLSNAPAEDVALAINNWLDGRQEVFDADPTSDDPFVSARRQVVVVEELVSNSLIISANPAYFNEVIRLIEDLDRRPPMVKIKVLIAEVRLSKLAEFGIEVGVQDSLLFDRGLGVIGFPFNQSELGNNSDALSLGTRELLAGQALSNLNIGRTNANLGYGGMVLSAGNESINVLIRALQDRNVARVLSTPDITTVENLQGRVQVGQQVPRVTGASQNDFGGVNTSVEDVDVGVILAVTPRVSPDGMIIMNVDAVNSQLGDESEGVPVFVSDGQVVRSPPIDIIQAQTTIMARSGQTVAFTGLIQDRSVKTKRGTPILSDLPVLGPLFSFEQDGHDRSELLIILTPYLVDSEAQIEASNQAAMSRMHWCMDDVADVYGFNLNAGFDPENVSPGAVPVTYYPDEDPLGESPQYAPLEGEGSGEFPEEVFEESTNENRGNRSAPAPSPSDDNAASRFWQGNRNGS